MVTGKPNEPVWPSDKVLLRLVSGGTSVRIRRLRLSFLLKSCGLWTLSCDFVPHNYETLKWLSSLPILMQESSHSGGDSIAIGI